MQPSDALAALSRMGLSLRPLTDGRLYVEPRDLITPTARELIVEHRDALLELVSSNLGKGRVVGSCLPAATPHVPVAAVTGLQSPKAQVDLRRVDIGAALDRLPLACDHRGRRLAIETRKFVTSPWFDKALECGWTLNEIFGVDRNAPLESYECWGLVVGLAWAPKRGDVIEQLNTECAVIRYRDGATKREMRRIERRFCPEVNSVLWWDSFALVGEIE